MEATRAVKRITALACSAVVASCVFAGSAFAATVHGADYYGAGSALEAGEVDVLNVNGSAGETVFLSVTHGDDVLAKNLPYTIGENSESDDGTTWAGVATLDIANLNLAELDGSYAVEAYESRAGGSPLYTGALYGVYADLPDGTEQLIGTRTANESELTAREYNPAETLYSGGVTYRLAGDATNKDGVLRFPYEAYDEATTVDGVIKYTDETGATVATTKIPGLASGEERTVEIPSVIKGDDGSVYRTVFFKDSVTAVNPGQTSFSVYCSKMSEADQALVGFYVATIQMVDEEGNVIATDSVNVTGEFVYTAPSVIYKTVTDDTTGESTVVTYDLAQSPTIRLSAANDGVLNRARTIQVQYIALDGASTDRTVTFNLIDGSKTISGTDKQGRSLGKQQAVATKDSPTVMPSAEIEVNGTKYYLAGDPSDYAYTLGSGATPTVNVYYTPEGFKAEEAYDVTVNYVNFSTDEVIESHVYESNPNENSRITIETPETFSAGGANYIRLSGQEDAIAHDYFSGNATYTVYYRDENDELSAGTVINRIRVVYEESPTSTTTTTTEDGTETIITGDATGDATGAGATADGTQALQLNDERTYNVMDGEDGNSTLTNESGVDSNTERIEDSETPLASGFDSGASSSAASTFAQMGQWLLPAGIAAAIAVIAVVAVIMIRRKRDEEYDF